MIYLWKEWKEQSRARGMWLSLFMVILISIFILFQSRSLPREQGFSVFLLSLYDMNVYLLPLLSLFLSSFSIMQEKEQKTLLILLTKRESYRMFLWKKSIAIQGVTLILFVGWYVLFSLATKFFLLFEPISFLFFISAVIGLLLIFNQIGLFLGSICQTRMQLVGAAIFTWFLMLFIFDLAFLNFLPMVNQQNIGVFSTFFFLDPLHTIHFYLETSLGLYSLDHLSRLMEKLVWMSPTKFYFLDLFIWLVIMFELAVRLHSKGERT